MRAVGLSGSTRSRNAPIPSNSNQSNSDFPPQCAHPSFIGLLQGVKKTEDRRHQPNNFPLFFMSPLSFYIPVFSIFFPNTASSHSSLVIGTQFGAQADRLSIDITRIDRLHPSFIYPYHKMYQSLYLRNPFTLTFISNVRRKYFSSTLLVNSEVKNAIAMNKIPFYKITSYITLK